MNRDPTAREWLRVVKYFKRTRHDSKDQARQLVRTAGVSLKSAKAF